MGAMDKLWTWLGISEEKEEYIEIPGTGEPEVSNKKSIANVVSIHSNKNIKVIVCEPHSFDEVQVIADHLKNRKQVILNFENTSPEVSQKIIDFISGTTYALDGNSQQLGVHIFLFTPSNVEITRDHRLLMRKQSVSKSGLFGGEKS